ncbi:MAG: hypothetical protein OXC00_05180, partial [Acidimicrobiaceae bacterium]|nr:hypothetical protein [Acidimicrobiaceae bacterium]
MEVVGLVGVTGIAGVAGLAEAAGVVGLAGVVEAAGAAMTGLSGLAAGVVARDRTALGRAITLVEPPRPEDRRFAQDLLSRLLPHAGRAHRVGISGVPGSGKSPLIDSLGTRLTGAGHRVGVLAVDPSSMLTGGSILGDKTRMA